MGSVKKGSLANKINKTYYDLLGVDRTATVDEIKRAYHSMAKQYHPDSHAEQEALALLTADLTKTRAFKILTFAYHTLTDERLRAEYDESIGPDVRDWGAESRDSFTEKLRTTPSRAVSSRFGALEPAFDDDDDGGMLQRLRQRTGLTGDAWYKRLYWIFCPPRTRR